MNIDTLLFGETVQDQRGNVRRDFGLCNVVAWGLIIALIYTYSGKKSGKRQKRGGAPPSQGEVMSLRRGAESPRPGALGFEPPSSAPLLHGWAAARKGASGQRFAWQEWAIICVPLAILFAFAGWGLLKVLKALKVL